MVWIPELYFKYHCGTCIGLAVLASLTLQYGSNLIKETLSLKAQRQPETKNWLNTFSLWLKHDNSNDRISLKGANHGTKGKEHRGITEVIHTPYFIRIYLQVHKLDKHCSIYSKSASYVINVHSLNRNRIEEVHKNFTCHWNKSYN